MDSPRVMILVCGLPGSGKSFFAERLAARLGAPWLSSDVIRSEIGRLGDYRLESIDAVYLALFERALEALTPGGTVVLDATFSSQRYRRQARATAARGGAALRIVWVSADEATTLARVGRQRRFSEAGPEVYRLLKGKFDPVEGEHLALDSSVLPIEAMLERAEAYLKTAPAAPGERWRDPSG